MGAPLRSLTQDQFEVTVDGRPRRVLSAELVDHAPPPAAAPRGDDDAAASFAYSSNDRPRSSSPPGRLFFILVDQSSFRTSGVRAVITATRRFVDRLQPTDRVGLVAFPGPGPVVRASADHTVVRLALPGIVGQNQPLRSTRRTNMSLAEAADITAGDATALSAAIERECRGLRGAERSLCVDEVREDARNVAMTAELQARLALTEMRRVIEALAVYRGTKDAGPRQCGPACQRPQRRWPRRERRDHRPGARRGEEQRQPVRAAPGFIVPRRILPFRTALEPHGEPRRGDRRLRPRNPRRSERRHAASRGRGS